MTLLPQDTERTTMLTPSEVLEFAFCPRFVYFMRCLNIPQFEDRRYKVQLGRKIHKKRTLQNIDYLRRKIRTVKKEIDVYLASPELRLRGIVDEILTLEDGSMAPLDYKYAPFKKRAYKPHELQVVMYGMLIKKIYACEVNQGYLCYIRDGSKLVEVKIREKEIEEAREYIQRTFDIIKDGTMPKKTGNRNRCIDCCYKNICV